jgi:hypothetical protein
MPAASPNIKKRPSAADGVARIALELSRSEVDCPQVKTEGKRQCRATKIEFLKSAADEALRHWE